MSRRSTRTRRPQVQYRYRPGDFNLVFQHITKPHWLLGGAIKVPKALQGQARRFWKHCLSASDGVLVWNGEQLVGFLRFDVRRMPTYRQLWALGTWVHPLWRGIGLGGLMWQRALRRHKPTRCHVGTISKGGHALAASLAVKYPRVKWELERLK